MNNVLQELLGIGKKIIGQPNPVREAPQQMQHQQMVQPMAQPQAQLLQQLGQQQVMQPQQQQGMPMFGNPQTAAPQNSLSMLAQGSQFNPGFTPYQNSGFGGPGYTANLQPGQQQPLNRYNPQAGNYFYDNY